MRLFNKKGDVEFDLIIKLVLALIVFIVIILLIFLLKDKSSIIMDKIKHILRFGA